MTTTWFRQSDLPTGWQSVPIRRAGQVLNGGTPTSDPENWGGELPFVTPPDLNGADGAMLSSTGRTLSKAGISGSGLAPAGSVLVSTRAPIGHVGRVGQISAFNQGCRAVALREGVDSRYVAAALVAARDEMVAQGQGTTFLELSTSAFASMLIPLPPLGEQRAIADYLEQETAQLDALVGKQEEFKTKLTERRLALISDAVIHGLTPEAPFKSSGADWFDVVPVHWRVERLKNSIMDAQTGVWGSDPVGDGSDILCVRVADFDRPLLRVGDAETMRAVSSREARSRLLQRGDLLLEKSGGTPNNPVGFVAMFEDEKGPAVTSNFITRLRLQDGQHPRYWLYAHATSYGTRLTARSVKQTTGIQNLDQASYFNEIFPFPPVEEQRAIAAYLDEQTSRIDYLIAKVEEHIALAKERRSALITAAVTGQHDVPTAGKAG